MAKGNTIVQVDNVSKSFTVGIQEIPVLKGVSFTVDDGDFVMIVGPSGCGKSTLLHCILGLEYPSTGRILFGDQDVYLNTTEDDRSVLRKQMVGMVYQQPNWIKSLNVGENVAFPLMLVGMEKEQALARAYEVINQVEMGKWATYMPTELSSGQQQRIALARGLVHNPQVIVADEPTGNLDFDSGQEMMQLLESINKDGGKTIIMVTHDLEYLKYAKRVVKMLDGKVENIYEENTKKNLIAKSHLKREETDQKGKI